MTEKKILDELECYSTGSSLFSEEVANSLDENDQLHSLREHFNFPKLNNNSNAEDVVYLCGNSLGLQPKGTMKAINTQMEKWSSSAVEGHFTGETPWLDIDDIVSESMARLVGAKRSDFYDALLL